MKTINLEYYYFYDMAFDYRSEITPFNANGMNKFCLQ